MDILESVIVALIVSSILAVSCLDIFQNGYFNPVSVYKKIKVNWFGAWFIAILCNIFFPLVALAYWFYGLLTIGRE